MHSKILILSAMLLTACSATKPSAGGIIGQQLDDSTPLYNAYGIQSDSVFIVDQPTHRILKVGLGDLTLAQEYSMTKPDNEHTLASNFNGAYVIDFSRKHLEVIKSSGEREERPFAFQGTPVSFAFNPTQGVLAMQDDRQSVGLMLLSDQGEILNSWLGGPLLGTDKLLLAGDIDSSGRLLLAASDDSMAIVDVEKSVSTSSWAFESFDTGIDSINWVAPDPDHADLSLIVAYNSLAVIDLQTKTVVDEISLSEKGLSIFGRSKLPKPHVLVNNLVKGLQEIYSIGPDGKILSQPLPQTNLTGYALSFFDAAASELTVLFSVRTSHRVLKLRMSDNLVVLDFAVESEGEAQLGPDLLLINKKSPLGYLQAHNLQDESIRELKGFNFEYFRTH